MRYLVRQKSMRRLGIPRAMLIVAGVILLVIVAVTIVSRQVYFEKLKPLSEVGQNSQLVTIETGSSVDAIGKQLEQAGLIQSAWAFKLYVSIKEVRNDLQAGTYSLNPSQSVSEIVAQLTHGKVATDLVTILPGQRLDQIRQALLNYGFSETDVNSALDPLTYAGNPALVDKPVGASLEGYLYPESFQKTATTIPHEIILQSLALMQDNLTPDLRAKFAERGLSTYQAITLASIVEQEASTQEDRNQVAQVYLRRLSLGMKLEADPTAYYGALLAGQPPSLQFDSPYNTYIYRGMPPTPISNVSASSLHAVAYPAGTDWLYFVAGDDGQTHFSHTLEEHQAATQMYCTKLCR